MTWRVALRCSSSPDWVVVDCRCCSLGVVVVLLYESVRSFLGVSGGFAALVLGGPSLAAAAAFKPITGTLDQPGFTVIALAENGQAGSVIAQGGSFSVVPPAAAVTLQLRAPDGIYAGPIVLVDNGFEVTDAKSAVASAQKKVTLAKAHVTRAGKNVKRARQTVTNAQRKLKHARGVRARRNARRRLARAKSQLRKANTQLKRANADLKKANTQLKKAKQQLNDAQKRAAEKPTQAIVGVKAGAALGNITVNAGAGYALTSPLNELAWKTWVDPTRTARANNGVPIGAGNFGRVLSPPPTVAPPGDLDADGVPDALDIDINGNLILNNVDRSTTNRARAAQAPSPFFIGANLGVPLSDTMNVDAVAVSDAQIDRVLSTHEWLAVGILPGSPELDCGGTPDPNNPQGWIGGLSYCRRGGTGTALLPGYPAPSTNQPFPACCDPDGDGFGALSNNSPNPPPGAFFFNPNATSSQIGTGDVLIQRVTSNGVTIDTPTMLPYIFATVPALVSYDDGQGNSATVNYPVAGSGPGTQGNPFPVAAGPNGDVALKLTFWRPQRRAIPPEQGTWTDIGKLSYRANVQSVGASDVPPLNRLCPISAYSDNDPNLSPPETLIRNTGFVTDLAPDQPANPANTITYTLNLTNCLTALGFAWTPGESALVNFAAVDGFASSATETDTLVVFQRR
jgi:hypothetical protein